MLAERSLDLAYVAIAHTHTPCIYIYIYIINIDDHINIDEIKNHIYVT